MAWEPPKEAVEETVALNGHTGWVRALATCGQWLFSGSCSTLRQWDMSRAVPRHKSDVKLDKGDITTLTTGNNSVYACSADGSIQCAPPPLPAALLRTPHLLPFQKRIDGSKGLVGARGPCHMVIIKSLRSVVDRARKISRLPRTLPEDAWQLVP